MRTVLCFFAVFSAFTAPAYGSSMLMDRLDVYFDFGSSVVSKEGTYSLNKYLESCSSKRLIVTGFSDQINTPEFNDSISFRRAEAIRVHLVSRGADVVRRVRGEAHNYLVYPERTKEDVKMSVNRRGEINCIK